MIWWPWTKNRAMEQRLLSLDDENLHLRQRVMDLETEKTLVEDRLRSSLEDRDKLWKMVEKAISEERTAYHMQINKKWQEQGIPAPYPDDPHIPGDQTTKPSNKATIGSFKLGSQLQAEVTQRFIQSEIARLDQTPQ